MTQDRISYIDKLLEIMNYAYSLNCITRAEYLSNIEWMNYNMWDNSGVSNSSLIYKAYTELRDIRNEIARISRELENAKLNSGSSAISLDYIPDRTTYNYLKVDALMSHLKDEYGIKQIALDEIADFVGRAVEESIVKERGSWLGRAFHLISKTKAKLPLDK